MCVKRANSYLERSRVVVPTEYLIELQHSFAFAACCSLLAFTALHKKLTREAPPYPALKTRAAYVQPCVSLPSSVHYYIRHVPRPNNSCGQQEQTADCLIMSLPLVRTFAARQIGHVVVLGRRRLRDGAGPRPLLACRRWLGDSAPPPSAVDAQAAPPGVERSWTWSTPSPVRPGRGAAEIPVIPR